MDSETDRDTCNGRTTQIYKFTIYFTMQSRNVMYIWTIIFLTQDINEQKFYLDSTQHLIK